MKILRTLLSTSALAALLLMSLPAFAQQNDDERDRMAKSTGSTITGCLTKSESGDHWVLTDNQSGAKTMVVGSPEFQKHANNTVKLYGAPNEDGSAFKVDKIEHVSDTCQSK